MVQSETGASHYWDWNSGREIYDYMTNRDDVMMPNDVTVSLGMRAVRCINDWEDLSEMDPDGSWAIKGLQCCVFVCDVSDRASLDLAHLKRLVARFPAANPSGQVDLVLVANKTDLPREEWQISPTMLHDTAAAFGATVVYISARSGWNCSGRKSMLWLTVLNLLYGPFDMPWNVELGHLRGLAALQIEPPIRYELVSCFSFFVFNRQHSPARLRSLKSLSVFSRAAKRRESCLVSFFWAQSASRLRVATLRC